MSMTFMSDRQKGLITAVQVVWPEAHHGHCLCHLVANFKNHLKGIIKPRSKVATAIQGAIWSAAKAATKIEYNRHVVALEGLQKGAINWYAAQPNRGPEHWAAAHFQGHCYTHATSNIAELFNAWLKEERALPITELIEGLCSKLQVRFDSARVRSFEHKASGAILSKFATVANKAALQSARFYYQIRPINTVEQSFQVSKVSEMAWYTVRLRKKYCACRIWQRSGLPCVHVACALVELAVCGNPAAYTSEVYACEHWIAAYAATIQPVAPECKWVAAEGDKRLLVLPPYAEVCQSGHLVSRRMPSRGMD